MSAATRAGTASADTLREALVSAYQANPTLTAQREALKATDATVDIARAQGRPQISGTVGLNQDLSRQGILDTGSKGPTLSTGVDLSLPLFNGGSVRNSVNAAKARVEAGRATLKGVEGDVFTQAVAAYMDVIRDRAIVELNQNNVKVLQTNLEATKDRFEIGEQTRPAERLVCNELVRSGQKRLLFGRQGLMHLFALALEPLDLVLALLDRRLQKVVLLRVRVKPRKAENAYEQAYYDQQGRRKIRQRPVAERMCCEIELCYHLEILPKTR